MISIYLKVCHGQLDYKNTDLPFKFNFTGNYDRKENVSDRKTTKQKNKTMVSN